VNGHLQNALPFLHHKENAPCYSNSGTVAQIWLYFFTHSFEITWLTAISSQRFVALPAEGAFVQQSHASKCLPQKLEVNIEDSFMVANSYSYHRYTKSSLKICQMHTKFTVTKT